MKLAMPAENPPTIGVAPLLDIVFLLLVFFMVTTSFRTAEIPLNLAAAESAAVSAEPRDVRVVEIAESGALHLDGEPLDADALASALAVEARVGSSQIVVRADQATPHGRVVTVLDIARKHGLVDVAIAVDAAPRGAASTAGRTAGQVPGRTAESSR